jgi:hypothetical protein
MEEKIVNRRKLPSVRAVHVSDNGEWKFGSSSDSESSLPNETAILNDEPTNKLRQTEDRTVKNIEDLIEENDIIERVVKLFFYVFEINE